MTTSREQLIEAITAQLQPPLVPPKEGVPVIGIQPYVVDRVLNALSDLGAVLLMPTKVAEIPEGSTVHLCPPTVSLNWPEGEYKPEIPVDRLVAYVNDQEGGNWIGRSYLRPLFKHFVRKDRLLRVDAINAERNGAGVPIAYAPPNATKDQMTALAKLAQSYRAGESAGGALPNGAELRFRSVEGTLPDVLASLRDDDEQMAAAFLAMFSKLGTTETGSRALGQTLVDFFALAQEAVAKQYADTTNEHVIEDLIDVNYGMDETAPLLKFETETDKRYSVADMKALIDAGALTTDPQLEAHIRALGKLPKKPEEVAEQDERRCDFRVRRGLDALRHSCAIRSLPSDRNPPHACS